MIQYLAENNRDFRAIAEDPKRVTLVSGLKRAMFEMLRIGDDGDEDNNKLFFLGKSGAVRRMERKFAASEMGKIAFLPLPDRQLVKRVR